VADFERAYEVVREYEGGYINDPSDAGGETFKGVSRRYNPTWPGWTKIDALKRVSGFPATAEHNVELNGMVHTFFKQKYWDANLLDRFSAQDIATEMFDIGINMGVYRAAEFLQKALNVLNKNERLYPDIVEDGDVGTNTLNALNSYLSVGKGTIYLLKVLNILQGMHYINYMKKSPVQEKYAYGWLNRVEINKSYRGELF
jgi:lysozyme family protein